MGGWLFLPFLWLVCWLEGAPTRVSIQFCAVFLLLYYIIRLMANLFLDSDENTERYWNNREHFGRPSFRCWVDKEGKLQVRSGPDPDHATRCQNSLRDWYKIERRLKWNNWFYGAMILGLYVFLSKY